MIYDFSDSSKPKLESEHWNTVEEFNKIHEKTVLDEVILMLENPDTIPLMAFGKKEAVLISQDQFSNPNDWYVIGDLHSDFYAFSNQLHWIKTNNPNFKLIFLGDLIDRGPHAIEVITLMLLTIRDYPGRVLWIAGNHDEAITLSENGQFIASVAPAEFTDLLNQKDSLSEKRKKLGIGFIEIAKRLPRAAFFPDGLLVTHGGFPLTDLQAKLSLVDTQESHLAWLNSHASLQDFTWTRITDWPKKIPNRTTKGCSYGFKDFASFCEVTKKIFGFQVQRLLTGHEHPIDGLDRHLPWIEHSALTIKGFGFGNNYEQAVSYTTKYDKNLIIARLTLNQIPEIIQIPVVEKDLYSFFSNIIMKLPEFHHISPTTASS